MFIKMELLRHGIPIMDQASMGYTVHINCQKILALDPCYFDVNFV